MKKRLDTLTGARFTAIMVIVFSHFEFLSSGSFGDIYLKYIHNPTMGVDFFFMLSGFGMMMSSYNKDPDGKMRIGGIRELINYAVKHVRTIYPVYFLMLLVGIPYDIVASVTEYGKTCLYAVVVSLVRFLSCATLLQSATGFSGFSHGLNGVGWFLSTLFCIYLVSPIIMKMLKRVVGSNNNIALVILSFSIVCSCALAILFDAVEQNTRFDDLCYGSPYRRVFYVICGMLIAQIYRNTKYRFVCSEYFTLLLAMGWFFFRNSTVERVGMFVYAIDMVICASVLYVLAIGKGKISKFFETKRMVYLGKISVWIFITHYLIRLYVDLGIRLFEVRNTVISIIEVIVILGMTIRISILLDRQCGKV